MQFVTEATWPPRACIVTGFGPAMTAKGRLLDTMATTETGERVYLSDDAVGQVAGLFGYVPADKLAAVEEERHAAVAEAVDLRVRLEQACAALDAVDCLEKAGYTVREKAVAA